MPPLTHDIFNLSLARMGKGEIILSKPNSPERQVHYVRAAGRAGNQVCVDLHASSGPRPNPALSMGSINVCGRTE